MLELRQLTAADRPALERWFERFPPEISELTYTNLWVWRGRRRVFWAETGSALVIRAEEQDHGWFFPPICLCDPVGVVAGVFHWAAENGVEPLMERVPETVAVELAAAGMAVAEDRDQADYVYLVSDLVMLEGRRYDAKRNFLNGLISGHNWEYRRIDAVVAAECLALEEDWCNLRHCDENPGLAEEQRAIRELLENWSSAGLLGGAVRVEGRVAGFAIGEKLNPTTAVVHFEKANPTLRGAYQLINQQFCANELLEFKFVNREQDLGIPGLRQAKLSYHPHHLVRKFRVRPAGV